MKFPYLVVSDGCGNIFEVPGIYMAGKSLNYMVKIAKRDLSPLPYGSDLYMLPGRVPAGFDLKSRKFVQVDKYRGKPVQAVAAFMAPAYMQLYGSAFFRSKDAKRLSLYSFTAVGWRDGKFYVAGIRIDPDQRQDPFNFDMDEIKRRAEETLKYYPGNRLVHHLVENCVFRYGCPAARNFVLGRWECPLPTSPGCNSECVGCISKQPSSSGVKASQERISFVPEVDEVVEIAVAHLKNAPRAVVSFGQGCEGEPLLMGELIEESIRQIRKKTPQGIININTNGSKPEVVEKLCRAGLDSIRVSINSAQVRFYNAYYKPRDYSFSDIIDSLKTVRHFGRWSSINYFIFPGFTDHPNEISAFTELVKKVRLNMIQTRNLNIDPDWYLEELGLNQLEPEFIGMRSWVEYIKDEFPWIKLGYFNPPVEEMKEEHFRFS